MRDPYVVAGIDVHKRMLAVVVADVSAEGDWQFERRKFGTTDSALQELTEWLRERSVKEAVMESTAQYWKPVWRQLEGEVELSLAQAHSNRAPRGRKKDFLDAERLVRRHVAGELILSFVPDPEQRMWRTITRSKYQLTRDRVRLQNQLESLLEDARIKLGSLVSDLLGVSSRRMLWALAKGATDPAAIAALADPELRATRAQLADAVSVAGTLRATHRQILKLFLERLEFLEKQIETLRKSIAGALEAHQDAVRRLAAVPGFGADSAQQAIAEVGPTAATFPSAGEMASWVGVCPGENESAEVSVSDRSPKGNRTMRRLLDQAAEAAVKTKGSRFQALYQRWLPRLGHNKAIWAIAHRLCRLVWKILHQGVEYIEYGNQRDPRAQQRRTTKLIRELKALGYNITPSEALPA
jgi:transposase